MRKVGRPKKERKLTMKDIQDDEGNIVSCGEGTKTQNARSFKKLVENNNDYHENTGATNKRGMYAGSANPESFIEMYKHTVANRQKKGSPWAYPSRKALEDEIFKYFEFCVDRRIPVTVAGVCAWLGISVRTMSNWERHQDTQPYYDIAESTVAFIHAMTEQGAVDGNIPASVFNFLAKNYHGLKDQMDYYVTPKDRINALEADEIIKNLPDVENNDET